MREAAIQQQVADYLRLQYPDVIFHSDFGSGVKLTMGQAVRQKRLNGGQRAYPDMFIAEPRVNFVPPEGVMGCDTWSHGLFLELKKDGTRIKKKNGEWASPHIEEQHKVLEALSRKGYVAEFAVGFDEAKRIIDSYLGARRSGRRV